MKKREKKFLNAPPRFAKAPARRARFAQRGQGSWVRGLLTLPGLIDPHVHLRDPGQTDKEDFYTGTQAALAGGYTSILDMPNNKIPITTEQKLLKKIKIAKQKIVCDVGFYFGSMGDNTDEFGKVTDKVLGLKLYLNETTGNFLIDEKILEDVFLAWMNTQSTLLHSNILSAQKPVLVHAEERMINVVLKLIRKLGARVHFCHITTKSDLAQILKAKKANVQVTCGVTPHHLFLTNHDLPRLGSFGTMKPPLATKKDQEFLWNNINSIDVIESDHAPHTINEKIEKSEATGDASGGLPRSAPAFEASARLAGAPWEERAEGPGASQKQEIEQNIPFGVPGLETTLPLLLTAVSENKLTIDDVVRLCFENPKKIFHVPRFDDSNHRSKVEIDPNYSYVIKNKNLFTKCAWTPFEGMRVKGKVIRTFIRGKKVFENGQILVSSGWGRVLT